MAIRLVAVIVLTHQAHQSRVSAKLIGISVEIKALLGLLLIPFPSDSPPKAETFSLGGA